MPGIDMRKGWVHRGPLETAAVTKGNGHSNGNQHVGGTSVTKATARRVTDRGVAVLGERELVDPLLRDHEDVDRCLWIHTVSPRQRSVGRMGGRRRGREGGREGGKEGKEGGRDCQPGERYY